MRAKVPAGKKYDWESDDYNEDEDEFLKHFDEEGNFVENRVDDPETKDESLKITYHYKKESKNEIRESGE
jgi:hypothetical protein